MIKVTGANSISTKSDHHTWRTGQWAVSRRFCRRFCLNKHKNVPKVNLYIARLFHMRRRYLFMFYFFILYTQKLCRFIFTRPSCARERPCCNSIRNHHSPSFECFYFFFLFDMCKLCIENWGKIGGCIDVSKCPKKKHSKS